jgi:probable rRNA maturation factor
VIHTAQVVAEEATQAAIDSVRRAALATLEYEDAPQGALSIVLADSESLRKLNQQFRQVDSATDVLAFPDGSIDPDDGGVYFGDVVIALPVADEQAKNAGHALESELALLTVHGVLHLLGHDHATEAAKEGMWSYQAAILRQLEIKVRLPL